MSAKTELYKIIENLNDEQKQKLLSVAKQINAKPNTKQSKKLPDEFLNPIIVKEYKKFTRSEIYDDIVS